MFVAGPADPARLVVFHTCHELLLLAHSPDLCRRLGRLVAEAGAAPFPELLADYHELLTKAMRLRTSVKKHAHVLYHMMDYFENRLSREERVVLEELIRQYAEEGLLWIVPVTLINHHVLKYGNEYLKYQVYLHPHPLEFNPRDYV